jgi:acetyl/propionyl-CoA carboxylase alpha subunit
LADTHGHVVHLFERECSIQRRHQKIVEETPSPSSTPAARRDGAPRPWPPPGGRLRRCRHRRVPPSTPTRSPTTSPPFFFLEMNTRLQVEHPVTELVTGLDLVEWQLRVAAGEPLPASQDDVRQDGHAIEVRLYAEDPAAGFLPQTGTVARFDVPDGPGHPRRQRRRVRHRGVPLLRPDAGQADRPRR